MYIIKNKTTGLYLRDTGSNYGITDKWGDAIQFAAGDGRGEEFINNCDNIDEWEVDELFWIAKTIDGHYLINPTADSESLPTSEDIALAGLMNEHEAEIFRQTTGDMFVVELAGPGGNSNPNPNGLPDKP